MANKPISTAPTTMGRHGRIHEQEAEREKGVTFGEPHPPTAPKTEKPADPFAPRQFDPKPETSRKERIAAGIETPPKPHPKSQSFQQPERKAETPPAGPPLTRAELVGAVETPVDIRTVQQAEAARLHELEQAEFARKQEANLRRAQTNTAEQEAAQRKANAEKAKMEADKAKSDAEAAKQFRQTFGNQPLAKK